MPNLIEAIAAYPTVNAFRRINRKGDDPRAWEYAPEPGDLIAEPAALVGGPAMRSYILYSLRQAITGE